MLRKPKTRWDGAAHPPVEEEWNAGKQPKQQDESPTHTRPIRPKSSHSRVRHPERQLESDQEKSSSVGRREAAIVEASLIFLSK